MSFLSAVDAMSKSSHLIMTLHERADEAVGSAGSIHSYVSLGSRESIKSREDSRYTEVSLGSDLLSLDDTFSEESILIGPTLSDVKNTEKHAIYPLEKTCFTLILEDAINQLEMVKQVLPKAYEVDGISYQSLQERYEPQGIRSLLYPDEHEPPTETPLMKIKRDLDFTGTILKRAKDEMEESLTIYTLTAAVEAQRQMKFDDETLEKEYAANKLILRNIEKEMNRIAKTVDESELKDSVRSKLLDGEIHDTIMETDIKKRYMCNWEAARLAQAKYRNDLKEGGLTSQLEEAQYAIDSENRINTEIETYINMNTQELEDSIESWMQRYNRESEEKDRELLKVRMDREQNMRNLTELQELYDLQKQELDEYNAIQEEIQERLEREALLNKMATRIQAWWRGLMVRRCLGPFKKKKKGKKDKGKEKGSPLKSTEKKQKTKKKR